MKYLVTYISGCDHSYRREIVSACNASDAYQAVVCQFKDVDSIVSAEPIQTKCDECTCKKDVKHDSCSCKK